MIRSMPARGGGEVGMDEGDEGIYRNRKGRQSARGGDEVGVRLGWGRAKRGCIETGKVVNLLVRLLQYR